MAKSPAKAEASEHPAMLMEHLRVFRGSPQNMIIGYGLDDGLTMRRADPLRGERQLGPFVIPAFQRASVWSLDQKVRLIESLWMGLPIAGYVLNQSLENDMLTDSWLIDGQQRWTAIREYAAGEFPVQGYRFTELSGQERQAFKMMGFPCIITNSPDPATLEDFYNRLAYGGTAHDPEDAPSFGP